MKLRPVLLLLAFAIFSSTVRADIAACVVGTYADYKNLTEGCSIGPVVVKNFDLLESFNGSTPMPFASADQIAVIPVVTRTGGVQIQFQGFTPYAVSASDTRTFEFLYAIDPPPIIAGEDVFLDPPFGTIFLEQDYCANCYLGTQVPSFAPSSFSNDANSAAGGIGEPIQLTFDPPLYLLDTHTRVVLNPGQNIASGFDGLVYNINLTDDVTTPEPASIGLCGLGIAGAVWARRRRRMAK